MVALLSRLNFYLTTIYLILLWRHGPGVLLCMLALTIGVPLKYRTNPVGQNNIIYELTMVE